ncbi:MAG: FG-GAP-like repeat-containing protein, partial [Nitrospirae bacterium]|nr:FG-GAP-like repeat-containing protein [Nitrospirota bacterium]
DFDNDGFVDVALSQGSSSGNFSGNDARIYLLRNNGDRTFRHAGDISIANGVWAPRGKWGDYDSDGDLDLIVASRRSSALGSEVSAVFLYRSNAGTFTNITNTAGFISINNTAQSTLWLDYDNDGYLDLFVDYRNKQSFGARGTDHLYHNNGDATFSEVLTSGDLGIDYSGERSGINADYDDDGFTDFLFWSGSSGTGLLLFHNKGDGTFEEVTAEAGISSDDRCIGAAFGDYDNDGKLDLYVLRHDQLGGPRPDRLFNNNGDGTFSEVGSQAGVSELLLISSEPPSWADYDNDGYLDLLAFEQQRAGFSGSIPRLYRNNGDETFTIVDAFPNVSAGIEGAAWADYDNDGDLDLLARAYTEGAILHRNNNNDNGWLSINLLGTQSHKNGYGARIRLRAGGLLQVRQINDGSGYTQHSLRAHFGLGKATVVDTLEIRWPSGQVDLLTNVDVSQIITVEEGNGMITGVTAKPLQSSVPETFKLAQNYPNPFNPGTRISFETSKSGQVQLTIFNLLGQEVITLVDEKRNAGEFVELWDGNDRSGKAVPSGVYVYRLQAGEFVESRKMLLLR